jgi:hypothetical protein
MQNVRLLRGLNLIMHQCCPVIFSTALHSHQFTNTNKYSLGSATSSSSTTPIRTTYPLHLVIPIINPRESSPVYYQANHTMPFLQAVSRCLGARKHHQALTSNEKSTPVPLADKEIATEVLKALSIAEKKGSGLQRTVQDIVGTRGWTDRAAAYVLSGVETVSVLHASRSSST